MNINHIQTSGLIGFLTICLTAEFAFAENWPQFRGPTGDGIAAESVLPTDFGESQNVTWKIPIHGRGWSSPVIWGDQIWVTTATEDGKKMSAICVDFKTGEVIHDLLVFENEKPRFCHATNSYASPTPVIEQGRVYVHFGSYGTACIDTETGKKLWERRDLPCDHYRGPGSSPVLVEGKLIVAYDGFDLQYVVAFDKITGKTAWKMDRNIDYGTDNGDRFKAYSTCLILEFDGRKQAVSPSATETISYDVETGKEMWRVRHGGMNAAARPLYGNGLIYIAAGDGGNSLIAVDLKNEKKGTDPEIAWGLKKGAPKRPSQILIGDRYYMIDDKGVFTTLNAKSGEQLWQARVGGNYRASPILANGLIYTFSEEGEVTVIKPGEKYEEVARNQFENGFQASPAVVGNSLILRTTKHLYRVD